MEYIKLVSNDANEVWLRWKAFFLDILNRHAPVTRIKIKGNSLPYLTSELKALIRTRDYLRAKANKTGSVFLRKAFKGQLQSFYKLVSYERAVKILKNDICITEIGQAVLEIFVQSIISEKNSEN